jgi:hypothetical protein
MPTKKITIMWRRLQRSPSHPVISDPAPNAMKPGGRVRQQFRIGHAERRPHHDDGGGEDQHRIMVDEMGGVDETDHPGRAVHGANPHVESCFCDRL